MSRRPWGQAALAGRRRGLNLAPLARLVDYLENSEAIKNENANCD